METPGSAAQISPGPSLLHRLSLSQHEVWLDQRAWPDSNHLNIGGAAFLRGTFELELFKLALTALVAESEALRLVPHLDGHQTLLHQFDPCLEIVDLSASTEPEQAMRNWWQARIRLPFALNSTPPWRFSLLRARDNLHGLTIQFHHLVMDGWGTTLIMKRWSELYNALLAKVDPPPAASLNYTSHIEESNEYKNSDLFDRDAAFWRSHFPGLPEPLIDRRHGRLQRESLPDSRVTVNSIARADYDRLAEFGTQQGLTPFHLFLAALAIYFARVCDRQEIVIGVPSLNRGGRRYRDTPGMFVGVMAIKLKLTPGMTVREFLGATGTAMRGALRHPKYPLSDLGRSLDLVRSGRDGLFDLLLSFERQDYKLSFGEADLVNSRQLFSGVARFPLSVTVCEFHAQDDLELILEASEACFPGDEAALVGDRLWGLVEALAENPESSVSSLSIIPSSEQACLDHLFRAKPAAPDDGTPFITQFEHHAALRPGAVALVWDGGSMSYGVLNERSENLARRLIEVGIAKENIVAFAIERSADMVVAVLAIAKAGAAFLPLDAEAPLGRLADILQESSAVALLIQGRNEERLAHLHHRVLIADRTFTAPAGKAKARNAVPTPEDLAYVLFTSGSTGRPKGVLIEHATLSRRLAWLSSAYQVHANDRTALATQITFDPSLIELCLPLVHGASIALTAPGRLAPESLADFSVIHGVTIMAFVPSTLSRFLDGAEHCIGLKLRVACCGGEVLTPELANRFHRVTGARLYNVYGPTEAAIFASAFECVPNMPEGILPIGQAIDNTRIYVLDVSLAALPFGVAGEICIAGEALARGYLNRPDLTEAAFVDDPFQPGSKMYRTGDRGWLGVGGSLHFMGRSDRQIKLRGYRIELGEIEAVLMAIEGVNQAAVKLIERNGKPVIYAWVASSGGHTHESLNRVSRLRLPDYMIPSGIMVLPSLPESSTGKIDFAALPAPIAVASTIARRPENKLESDLLRLWREVLDQPNMSIQDNFFDLGGDSLAAVSVLTGIEKMIGRRVPMYLITERPTVEGLASALGEESAAPGLMVNLGSAPNLERVDTKQWPSLYLAASGHGDLMRFQNLARALGDCCDLQMLQPPSASTIARTTDLAHLYADSVMKRGTEPCYVAGFSVGGLAALETAKQLTAKGVPVLGLYLIDTIYPSRLWGGTVLWRLLGWLVRKLRIQDLSLNGRRLGAMLSDPGLMGQVMAVKGYRASIFDGPIHLVKSTGLSRWDRLLFMGWRRLIGKRLIEHRVAGLHGSMFEVGNVEVLAKVISDSLQTSVTTKMD